MVLAPTSTVVLGSVAFGIFWVLAVFPAVPFLPIGRTAGSLLSAMLMVIFGVISPDEAYAAIDLPILGLLFGTMVVSAYLEGAGLFVHLGTMLAWKSKGRKDLLCRICLVSAISSALFTNDTCCVVLTGFVLKIARQNNLPPQPFLLALASSSNIGSAATPIGNPQNLVIAAQSKISFGKFLLGLLPAMLVGVLVNAGILLAYYWKQLSIAKDVEANVDAEDVIAGEEVTSHRFSPATMSHVTSFNSEEWNAVDPNLRNPSMNGGIGHTETLRNRTGSTVDEVRAESTAVSNASSSLEVEAGDRLGVPPAEEEDGPAVKRCASGGHSVKGKARWKMQIWKACVYLVTVGMLVALLMGLNMSWSALTAALALIILDFKDAQPCLEKVVISYSSFKHPKEMPQTSHCFSTSNHLDQVSYSLLIFFCGMFITVEGFNKTGIPSALWDLMEPHSRIDRASGIAVLSVVILLLSNVASNVPTGSSFLLCSFCKLIITLAKCITRFRSGMT